MRIAFAGEGEGQGAAVRLQRRAGRQIRRIALRAGRALPAQIRREAARDRDAEVERLVQIDDFDRLLSQRRRHVRGGEARAGLTDLGADERAARAVAVAQVDAIAAAAGLRARVERGVKCTGGRAEIDPRAGAAIRTVDDPGEIRGHRVGQTFPVESLAGRPVRLRVDGGREEEIAQVGCEIAGRAVERQIKRVFAVRVLNHDGCAAGALLRRQLLQIEDAGIDVLTLHEPAVDVDRNLRRARDRRRERRNRRGLQIGIEIEAASEREADETARDGGLRVLLHLPEASWVRPRALAM